MFGGLGVPEDVFLSAFQGRLNFPKILISDHFAALFGSGPPDTCDYLLGIKIDQGTDAKFRRYVELNNATNIEKVARLADVNDSLASVRSPMEATHRLHKRTEGEDGNSKYVPNYEYAQVLGGIMYIANTSRPDLLTSLTC